MNTGASKPQITVILPTFNRANFLREALYSLRLQTLTKSAWRVVVLDNASTDSTRDVVAGFSDLPLVYDRSASNVGSYANFERGFRGYMDTEFFAILCDDDLYAPHFLATALDGIRSNSDGVLFACGALFGGGVGDFHRGICDWPGGLTSSMTTDRHQVRWSRSDWLAFHSVGAPIILPGCLFRTTVLRGISPTFSPTIACSDRWLLAQLGALSACHSTPWPGVLIRFHEHNGWTRQSQEARVRAERECSDLVLKLCEQHGIDVRVHWSQLASQIRGGLPERLKEHIYQNYPADLSKSILGDWEPNTGVLSQLKIPRSLRPGLRLIKRTLW